MLYMYDSPMWLSPSLQAFLKVEGASRGEVVKMMWDYIRLHNLQDPKNKRSILADDALKTLFGRDKFTMYDVIYLYIS
jgi:upstream activation factor subunit UAF30